MYKQIGHLTASTIDNICFVDTESTSTLVIVAVLSYMNLYLTSVSSVCGPVIWLHLTPATSTLPYGTTIVGGSPSGLLRH